MATLPNPVHVLQNPTEIAHVFCASPPMTSRMI